MVKAFQAVAIVSTMVSPAIAGGVPEAAETYEEIPETSLGTRGTVPEDYSDWLEKHEGRASSLTLMQMFARLYQDKVALALPSIMKYSQEKAIGKEYEKAFEDHGDTVQVVEVTMRKAEDGLSWTPVNTTPLHSGKSLDQASILSWGTPSASLMPGREKNDLSVYQAVTRQADGTWKLYPFPLEYNEAVLHSALSQFDLTKAQYERQDLARDSITRGNANFAAENYEEARRNYGMAITSDPSNPDGFIGRGNANYNLKNYDDAVIDYNKALARDTQNAAVYAQRADAYVNKQEYARAIADYTKALTVGPESAALYTARGQTYRSINDSNRALADFNQSVRLDPSKENLAQRGYVYYEMNNYTAATNDFNAALKIDSKFEAASTGLVSTQTAIKNRNLAAPAPRPPRPGPRGGIGPMGVSPPGMKIIIPLNGGYTAEGRIDYLGR